jgi:DNA-binding XRE family transcriptional regulator
MSRSDDKVAVGKPIPRIRAAKAGEGYSVAVTWENGTTDGIDLLPFIFGYKVFRPLRNDRALFESLQVDEDGTAIVWTDAMDMAAYTLERLAESQRVWTTDDVRDWMKRHHLTLDSAAPVLGVSRRTMAAISSGERPVDLTLTLALRGYDKIMDEKAA